MQSERYLLTVMRYIELNPVRAAMVEAPEDYRWSSVHTHLARARDPLITLHPLYLAMGSNPSERALGDERFQHMVETTLGRPVTCRTRGRPRQVSLREPI